MIICKFIFHLELWTRTDFSSLFFCVCWFESYDLLCAYFTMLFGWLSVHFIFKANHFKWNSFNESNYFHCFFKVNPTSQNNDDCIWENCRSKLKNTIGSHGINTKSCYFYFFFFLLSSKNLWTKNKSILFTRFVCSFVYPKNVHWMAQRWFWFDNSFGTQFKQFNCLLFSVHKIIGDDLNFRSFVIDNQVGWKIYTHKKKTKKADDSVVFS